MSGPFPKPPVPLFPIATRKYSGRKRIIIINVSAPHVVIFLNQRRHSLLDINAGSRHISSVLTFQSNTNLLYTVYDNMCHYFKKLDCYAYLIFVYCGGLSPSSKLLISDSHERVPPLKCSLGESNNIFVRNFLFAFQ